MLPNRKDPAGNRTTSRAPSRLLVAALTLGAVAAATAATAVAQENPVATAAVQVTPNADPARAHSSPQMALNPLNGELVIVETEVRTKRTCDVHLSVDDGRTWFTGGDPMMQPYTDCSGYAINGPYATAAFARDGTLFVAFIANDPAFNHLDRPDRPRHVFLARSSDGGRSFTTSIAYEAPEGVTGDPRTNNQRPMVTVDPHDPDRVYLAWMQRGVDTGHKSLVAASSDGGRTFAEPVQLSNDDEHGGYQPRLAVDHQGTVHAIFPSAGYADPRPDEPIVRPLFYTRSSDHGATWTPVEVIDEGNAGFSFMRKQLLAADPRDGTLYAVWYGHPDPRAARPDADADIFVRVSTDGGRSWGDRVVVNDDGAGAQQYDPGISIAPDGRVDIAWYDFRLSPVPEGEGEVGNAGGYNDIYYSYSNDRGATFAPNVRVSDRSISREIGVWSNNVHSHTNVGIASTGDAVYVAWQDSRNGDAVTQAEDVYFATVKLDGPQRTVAAAATTPAWLQLGAMFALGLGVAMIVSFFVARRMNAAGVGAGRPARARHSGSNPDGG